MKLEDPRDVEAIHNILRALPRKKITPETIDQHLIDKWYAREDDYRQRLAAIAEFHHPVTPDSQTCTCGLTGCPTAALVTGRAPSMERYIDERAAEIRAGLALVLDTLSADHSDRAMKADSRSARDAILAISDAYANAAKIVEGDQVAPAATLTQQEHDVRAELARQNTKWGQQDHPALDPRDIDIVTHHYYSERAKGWQHHNAERAQPSITIGRCDGHSDGSTPHTHTAWDGILLEEVYEALAEPDPAKRNVELVQVEAVCRQWRLATERHLTEQNQQLEEGRG